MNKSAYGSLATDEAVDGMLSRINEEFSVSVKDDVDSFLSNIFRRGWKVSHIDLSVGRIYSAKFFREVGDQKSRMRQKKDKSLKRLLLKILEYVLEQERLRFKTRISKSERLGQ